MSLPKRSSFKSVLNVYTLSKILLWIKPSYFSLENACYSWCMHKTGLFGSASVVPQSKFTGELWTSASVVPQSKSTELCSWAAVVPQSKSTELCSSSAAVIPQSKSTGTKVGTASPGRINSDRLGSNKKNKNKMKLDSDHKKKNKISRRHLPFTRHFVFFSGTRSCRLRAVPQSVSRV